MESLQQMKQNKHKDYREKIEDLSGMVEEHIFILPRTFK